MKSTQGQCQIDSQAVNQNTFSEYGKYFEYIVKCATSSPETFNFCCKNCTSRVKRNFFSWIRMHFGENNMRILEFNMCFLRFFKERHYFYGSIEKICFQIFLGFWMEISVPQLNRKIPLTLHCLKIIQNVAFEFINLGLFRLVLLQLTGLVTLFDRKLQVFKKLAKMDHFWHF